MTPYEKFVPYPNASRSSHDRRPKRVRAAAASDAGTTSLNATPGRNYAAGKTKMVAWFVSNCGPKNKRGDYADELAKYGSHDYISVRIRV